MEASPKLSRWSLCTAVVVLGVVVGHARSAAVVPIDSSSLVHTARANVSTAGRQSNGAAVGAVVSASGRYVAFASAASTLVRRDRNGTSDVFVHDLRSGRTTRVSVSSTGAEGDGPSLKPSISADGSLVAFPSWAGNLVPADRNRTEDVFVRNRVSGATERVSQGLPTEPNGPSRASLVSGNGRVVVFSSEASNLVPGDRNGALDVFVTELASGRTTRVSLGSGRSEASSVDADGAVVGFRSFVSTLVSGDRNQLADVFVVDRSARTTERVNVSSAGTQANAPTFRGMVSGNGRFVGFRSRASNLVPGDTNRALDAFVHDRLTKRTTRVSVSSDGLQADASAFAGSERGSAFMSRPFLSADGRYAAFSSRAPNLVAGDRNGKADVFVHDLITGRTIIASVAADGRQTNGDSFVCGISADGRVIAFTSLADNVVPGDTNERKDVFVAFLRRTWTAPASTETHRRHGPKLAAD
jgi:Tol biopolymer transport system component